MCYFWAALIGITGLTTNILIKKKKKKYEKTVIYSPIISQSDSTSTNK